MSRGERFFWLAMGAVFVIAFVANASPEVLALTAIFLSGSVIVTSAALILMGAFEEFLKGIVKDAIEEED